VDHRALKRLELFPTLLGEDSKLKVANQYKKYNDYIPESDLIIMQDGKKYFIIFPKEKTFDRVDQQNDIISLDPGVKKFQSFYTPDGYCGSIGNRELRDRIMGLERRHDKLKSKSTKTTKTTSKSLKDKLLSICYDLKTKVKNILRDFHWKVSSFLTKTYKEVLLPVFATQQMKPGLGRSTNRVMDIYSHYKFQQKMLYQGKKYGSNVRIVDESYTTKTCGNCGCMNHFVGNNNVFWCPFCKIDLERDYQAARNILLKNTVRI
jgi:putative transposase